MANKKIYLDFREDELSSAAIYEALAGIEKDERIRQVYEKMAAVERKHAKNWEEKLRAEGVEPPPFQPTLRVRLLIWLAKRFGPEMIIPSLQAMEKDGGSAYLKVESGKHMARDEQTHALVLGQIKNLARSGMEGSALAQLEGRHRSTGGNALRAAVLGANDGLVSNLSLVMGVAGATMDNRSILVAGIAGLLAGAFSMALGEWLSVQSSRELYANQIKIEELEIEQAPEEEAEELALIYEYRGIPAEQASQMARKIMQNKEGALDTLAREELGIDPEELGGSAWEAAITSFILFAIGAVIPVLPYTFLGGTTALLLSILLSVFGLFVLGAAITLFTGRSILYSGARMVIFGMLAAAITFGIGRLIGISIAG
ncbi:VIT1/CCC1 family protein [Bellilinea sp.]|uniref:VIT1/CCC1 family protein n=1 Tax=Bellilinea sp. TaxID=2838785 RepID=UPI002ADE3983|nr:VIT1/CCC1 family protein [Bellilinea sp.]